MIKNKKAITLTTYWIFFIFNILLILFIQGNLFILGNSLEDSKIVFEELSYNYISAKKVEEKIIQNSLSNIYYNSFGIITTNLGTENNNNEISDFQFKLKTFNTCYNSTSKLIKLNNDKCKFSFNKKEFKGALEFNFRTNFEKLTSENYLTNNFFEYDFKTYENKNFEIFRKNKIEEFVFYEKVLVPVDLEELSNVLSDIFEFTSLNNIETQKLKDYLNSIYGNERIRFQSKNENSDIIELYYNNKLVFYFLNEN